MPSTLQDVRRIPRRYPARTVLHPTAGQRHSRLGSRDRTARRFRPGLFVPIAASCGETGWIAGSSTAPTQPGEDEQGGRRNARCLEERPRANGSPRSWKRRRSPGRRRRSLRYPAASGLLLLSSTSHSPRALLRSSSNTLYRRPTCTRKHEGRSLSARRSQVLLIASVRDRAVASAVTAIASKCAAALPRGCRTRPAPAIAASFGRQPPHRAAAGAMICAPRANKVSRPGRFLLWRLGPEAPGRPVRSCSSSYVPVATGRSELAPAHPGNGARGRRLARTGGVS